VGIYSNAQIRTAIENGEIVCAPFTDTQLTAHTLGLTLGNYYYRTDQDSRAGVYNTITGTQADLYFAGPFKALPYARWCSFNQTAHDPHMPVEAPVIAIAPGERIVTHAHEFIAYTSSSALFEQATDWTRLGIYIEIIRPEAATVTRPLLIITNNNMRKTVVLPVGSHMADVRFLNIGQDTEAGETFSTPVTIRTDQVDLAIKLWSPESLLPTQDPKSYHTPTRIEGLRYE